MEDDTVVSALLEDLLPGRFVNLDGPQNTDWYSFDSTDDNENDNDNDTRNADDLAARCHAILMLPLLLRRNSRCFGPRWAAAALPSFLLRCLAENEDADEVRVAVGMALLGLLLPQPRPSSPPSHPNKDEKEATNGKINRKEEEEKKEAEDVLTLRALWPVVEQLAAGRRRGGEEGAGRYFLSRVVLPRLCFGTGLGGEGAWAGWAPVAAPPRKPSENADDEDRAARLTEREMTQWDHNTAAGAEEGDLDQLLLQEMLNFTYDDEVIHLCPSVRACNELWWLRSDEGFGRLKSAVAHRQRRAYVAPTRTSLPFNVPLGLYGASCAAPLPSDSGIDAFSLNLRARLMVSEMVSWLSGFMSAQKQQGPSQRIPSFLSELRANKHGRIPNTKVDQMRDCAAVEPPRPLQYQLNASDYLEHGSPQRAALRQRWEHGQGLLHYLLDSPYPGAVAVAVEMISGLLHVIQNALAEGPSSDTILSGEGLVSIALPQKPLRTAAELQHFIAKMSRRNVLMVLAAAISSRETPNTVPETVSLVREALIKVREGLRSILERHHLLVALQAVTSSNGVNGQCAKGRWRLGPGPCKLRVALLAAWDVSLGWSGPNSIPHLLVKPPSALESDSGSGHCNSQTGHSEGDVFLFSSRLHRIVQLAMLRSLPLLLDWGAVFGTASSSVSPPSFITIKTFVEIFMQLLVPASKVPELSSLFDAMVNARGWSDIIGLVTRSETNPLRTDLNFEVKLGSLDHSIEETVALLDYNLVEGALEAAHRCFVEAAIALPMLLRVEYHMTTSASLHTHSNSVVGRNMDTKVKDLLSGLLILYYMCAKYVAFYPSWKARWLVAKKLPGLTAAFVYVLLCLKRALATVIDAKMTPIIQFSTAGVSIFYCQLCKFLTELWLTGGGVACPLSSLASDEEAEVRVMALPCAVDTFLVMAQGLVGLCPSEMEGVTANPSKQTGATTACESESTRPSEMLVRLLEAILQVSTLSLQDANASVRAAAPTALASLSRAVEGLAGLVLCPEPNNPSSWNETFVGRALHASNKVKSLVAANALVRLMEDSSPLVRLAAASALADSIASLEKQRCKVGKIGQNSSAASQAQCRALLLCLENLFRHDVWRFRAKYSALLGEVCFKFLAPTYPQNLQLFNSVTTGSNGLQKQPTRHDCGVRDHDSYSPPLLIYTKLLPMLVEVLFDKAKAVRDTALGHLSLLCNRLASVLAHSVPLLEKDRLVRVVLWPLITSHPAAWSNYLNRSALLCIAVHLGVDVGAVLLPLLSKLAQDSVPNVRSMVAKTILEVLHNGLNRVTSGRARTNGLEDRQDCIQNSRVDSIATSSSRNMKKCGQAPGSAAVSALDGAPPSAPLIFTDKERNGIVLVILRQLLDDTSVDVRNQAAEALRICF